MNITTFLLVVLLTFYLICLQDKVDNHDRDTDVGNEYCSHLNQNFLDLLESAIQDDFLKDDKLSDKDIEEVCIILSKINVYCLLQLIRIRCLFVFCGIGGLCFFSYARTRRF